MDVRNDDSHRRNRVLFGMEAGEVDFGPYGFGRARTLADYERYAGLNFRLRLVQPYTLRDDPPPNPEIYATDEEWIAGCVKDYWLRIRLPPDAIDGEADYDFWYVGVHDGATARSIARTSAPSRSPWCWHSRSPTSSIATAPDEGSSWTVWPHSRSRGWLQRITGPIRP